MERLLRRRGFTLIELLLVIGIIAILASIVIIAINPNRQLGQARDAQRRSDVNTILNAVYQYAIDNNGSYPNAAIDGTEKVICQGHMTQADCDTALGADKGVSLRILTGAYLLNVPKDPSLPTYLTTDPLSMTGTRYTIQSTGNSRITVKAYGKEQAASDITVTR